MTLPNKIGYDVHTIAIEKKRQAAEQHKQALLQQQLQYGMDMRHQDSPAMGSPTEVKTTKKRTRAAEKEAQNRRVSNIKEEIEELDRKFESLITSGRNSIKKTRINLAGAENQNYPYGHHEEETGDDPENPNKRRKINDDQHELEAEELLNKITHLSELFLQTNEKEKHRLAHYLQENRDQVLSLLVKAEDDKQYPVDFERIKHSVVQNPLHSVLYRLVSQMIPARIFQPEDKPRPTNLIEMSQDDILVMFLGKDNVGQDKEESQQFLERFDTLQQTYRQELEHINNARDVWLGKFNDTLREHSEVRFVSDEERQRVLYATKSKFDHLTHALQDKYLSQIFNLQESVLLRSKKRGNLPKHATNVLKTWLFSNFLHPYPSEAEKVELSQQTQLTITQINNWFINARVRTWRPMLESMLEDKNKQSAAMSNQNTMQQQQYAAANQQPRLHQTTSSTQNGSVFTTLPNFVGQGGPQQVPQQSPTQRYNTRRSAKEAEQMNQGFPHLWHANPDEGGDDQYQGNYDDQFN